MTTLHEAVEVVVQAIVDTITEGVEDSGGELTDVEKVVRGDRMRGAPEPGTIWVVPRAARYTPTDYVTQGWTMPVDIAAITKDDDAEEGSGAQDAQRLAAEGMRLALGLAREDRSWLIDVRPESFDPTARGESENRSLYWCYATVRVTFDSDDVQPNTP